MRRIGKARREEVSRWQDGDRYPTDIYGEPIFSFDYSTRANALPALSAIASDGRPRSEILETEKSATEIRKAW